MRWIFITILFKSVVTQNLHYDCYGAGLMDGNCSSTQKIYPLEVEVGTKERSLNCSMEYTPDLNWTMTQFDMCCRPESGDTCRGKYTNVDNPLSTFIFHEYCIGRSACRVLQVTRVDTAYLSCDPTQYYAQTTFMAMEYDCIEESKIGTINTVVSKQSDSGDSVYLKGEDYELSLGILASVSSQSCSVEASSCESTISIEGLDIRLANDGSACKQNITIVDGYHTKTLDCSSNINFTSFGEQSTSSYLHITFLNSMSSNGGHFWFGFRTNSPETVRLDCPAKAPQNECITTTTETTTTTELTTTSTEPVTTSTEPVTTSSQPNTTTTESDTTSTESDNSSTLGVTTTATTKTNPKASESLDIKVVILPVIGFVVVVAVIVIIVTWLCWRKNKVACSTSKVEKENRNMERKNESNPSDIVGRQIPANDVKTNVEDKKDKKNKKKKKKKRMKKLEQQEERNIINDHGRTLQTGRSEESKFGLGPIYPSHEDQRGNNTHSNNAVIIEDEEKNARRKKKKRRKQCEPEDEIEMVIEGKAEIHFIKENTDVKKKKKKKKKSGWDMTNEDDMDGETDKKSKKKKKRRSKHETNETENNESRTENI